MTASVIESKCIKRFFQTTCIVICGVNDWNLTA